MDGILEKSCRMNEPQCYSNNTNIIKVVDFPNKPCNDNNIRKDQITYIDFNCLTGSKSHKSIGFYFTQSFL